METMRFFACWGATLALGAAAADDEGGGRRWFERVRARRRASERARVRAPARGVRHGRARDASVRARGRRRAPRRVRADALRLREEEERRSASATGSARRRRPGVEELGTANGGRRSGARGSLATVATVRRRAHVRRGAPRGALRVAASASVAAERTGANPSAAARPRRRALARKTVRIFARSRTRRRAREATGRIFLRSLRRCFFPSRRRSRRGLFGDRCRFRPSAASRGAAGTGAGAGTLANRGTPRGASSRGSTSRTPGKEAREGGGDDGERNRTFFFRRDSLFSV